MPTREVLSPAQRASLLTIPADFSERELARYYTLTEEDLAIIQRRRRPENKLGFAVQLGHLRFPGWPWDPAVPLPATIVAYIARQLDLDPAHLQAYAMRDPTRREHLSEIQRVFGFRPFTLGRYRDLARWLLPTALATDVGAVLVGALIDELRLRQIIIPALSTLEGLVWETRRRARRQVYSRLTANLSLEQQAQLEELLDVVPEIRQTRLVWLRQPPGVSKPATVLKLIERIRFIRALGLDPTVTRQIHQNRLLQLAREGARSTPQRLENLDVGRRLAILVAFLVETAATLTDYTLEMHDRIMTQFLGQCKQSYATETENHGPALRATARRYAAVGKALITARDADQDPFSALQSVMPWERFVASVTEAETLLQPKTGDYLDGLSAYYPQLRKYAPLLLDTFTFAGAPSSTSLLKAVQILQEINAGVRKKIPGTAPRSFVMPRWADHVLTPTGIDRQYYEFAVLHELRNHLRAGDVWVRGSRQFREFDDYLIPLAAWEAQKQMDEWTLAVPQSFTDYLVQQRTLLHEQLTIVNDQLAAQTLQDVTLRNGKLRLTRLEKAVPDDIEEFTRRVYAYVPFIKLTELMLEVDASTRFSRHATHLQSGAAPKDITALYAVILADAINLGLTRMADAVPGMTFERLAWVADWYVREDTYTKMLAEIVNRLNQHPFAANWGPGTTSSSDTQWFPSGGRRNARAQVNAKYGRRPGLKIGTHLSDRYAPYFTNVITSTAHEAPYVVDGLLYHETDLKIREHYTDTGGYTEQVFATLSMLGFRFAPRIRHLGDLCLYALEPPSSYPTLEPLIRGTVNLKRLETYWDDILRFGASIQQGTVTASLILRKLAAYPRQNSLALALRDMGHLERTLFELAWVQDAALRRRVLVGLNKGESRNALARAVRFNRGGEMHDRSYEDQQHRASGLNLIVAAIALWNTVHLDRAVSTMREQGIAVPEEYLRHLSPLHWDHILLSGDYHWNRQLKTNLEQLRPLPKKARDEGSA